MRAHSSKTLALYLCRAIAFEPPCTETFGTMWCCVCLCFVKQQLVENLDQNVMRAAAGFERHVVLAHAATLLLSLISLFGFVKAVTNLKKWVLRSWAGGEKVSEKNMDPVRFLLSCLDRAC